MALTAPLPVGFRRTGCQGTNRLIGRSELSTRLGLREEGAGGHSVLVMSICPSAMLPGRGHLRKAHGVWAPPRSVSQDGDLPNPRGRVGAPGLQPTGHCDPRSRCGASLTQRHAGIITWRKPCATNKEMPPNDSQSPGSPNRGTGVPFIWG